MKLKEIEEKLSLADKLSKKDILSLKTFCHPDLYEDNDKLKDRAKVLFQKIIDLEENINNPLIIKTKRKDFKVLQKYHEDGISDTFIVESNKKYLLKLSKGKQFNLYLKNEKEVLKKLYPDDEKQETFKKYMPNLVEDFVLDGKVALVYKYCRGYIPLSKKNKEYENKIPLKHIAWIYRRLYSILGYIHSKQYIYGSINPDSIWIHGKNHGVILWDFGFCHSEPHTYKSLPLNCKQYYPPEIIFSKEAGTNADLFSSAILFEELVKNLPDGFYSFMKALKLCKEFRPSDTWWIYDEFSQCLERYFGKPTYAGEL